MNNPANLPTKYFLLCLILLILINLISFRLILPYLAAKGKRILQTGRDTAASDDPRFVSLLSTPEPNFLESRVFGYDGVGQSNQSALRNFTEVRAPSVFLEIKGGLGNQLFQYACSYALARKFNIPLYVRVLDERTARSRSYGPRDRPFVLDHFKIPFPPALSVPSSWNVRDLTKLTDQDLLSHKVESLSNLDQRILTVYEFCISETYFLPYKEEVRRLFEVKEETLTSEQYREMSDRIRQSNCPVCVHFRRGDFADYRIHSVAYYREALEKLKEALRKKNVQDCLNHSKIRWTFLFSDGNFSSLEKEFGANFFRNLQPYTIVSGHGFTSVQEFKLMSECDHNVIPDSSYAWWAAYLNRNKDKVVVAGHFHPKVYPGADHLSKWQDHYFYPADWIAIDPWLPLRKNTTASKGIKYGKLVYYDVQYNSVVNKSERL